MLKMYKMKKNYRLITQKILVTLMLASISIMSMATNYYVSNSGNDTNSGLTQALPWKTIDKVNTIIFKAGDKILFQRGSTFSGSLTLKQSGVAGNLIKVGAYGSGTTNPVFNGLVTVTSWTSTGTNIWESTSAVSTLPTCNLVIINDVNTGMGRFPNSGTANGGYLPYQSHGGNLSITSSSLTGTPNWTGADAVIKTQHFSIDRSTITSQTGGTLNLKVATVCTPSDNYGFFIENDLRTLDIQNEWYYNPTTKKLSVYSTTAPTNVKVATIEKFITINANYIIFDSLNFIGANSYAIFHWEHDAILSNTTIQNCNFKLTGQDAIHLWSDQLLITNNQITDSNNKAIDIAGATNVTLNYNTVKNSGILNGMHQANGTFSAIQIGGKSNTPILVANNTIINSAHNGMTIGADKTTVINNFIDTFCTLIDDGAAIYGGNNAIITGNILVNGIGDATGTYGTFPTIAAGVYLDINSSNVEISNNSVSNTASYGIFINVNLSNIKVIGNNVFNSSDAQLRINYQDAMINYNYIIKDNIFVSKKANQYTAYYNSVVNNISMAGSFKSNYYIRPLDDTKTIEASQPSEYGGKYLKTLTDWQSFTGQDSGAHKSPQLLTSENDFQFEYNNTLSPVTKTLTQPMIDVKGVKYDKTVVIQSFRSILLMKDQSPAKYSSKNISICNGSNYNGWTTSGTYTQKFTTKTGADSIVTIYLTVSPTYNLSENITIKSGENYNGWNTTGNYVRNLTTKTGCDSIITTHLTVTQPIITTTAPIGSYITLKGNNNMFVSSENGAAAMNCNRTYAYAYEKFLVVDAGGGLIALQCGSNGLYVTGSAPVWCTATTIGGAQKFSWISPATNQVQLKCSSNNLFISSESGTTAMNCNRTGANAWETFTWATSVKSEEISGIDSPANESVKIYPTIVTEAITIENENSGESRVLIYDMSGKQIVDELINDRIKIIDFSLNKKGLYIVKVINGTYTKTLKVIKE